MKFFNCWISPKAPLYDMSGHDGKTLCAQWSGSLVVSGATDNTLKIFSTSQDMMKKIWNFWGEVSDVSRRLSIKKSIVWLMKFFCFYSSIMSSVLDLPKKKGFELIFFFLLMKILINSFIQNLCIDKSKLKSNPNHIQKLEQITNSSKIKFLGKNFSKSNFWKKKYSPSQLPDRILYQYVLRVIWIWIWILCKNV